MATDRTALQQNEVFRSLPASTRQSAMQSINGLMSDPTRLGESERNISMLASDPSFARLDPAGQRAALHALDREPSNATLRQDLQNTVRNANFQRLNRDTQSQTLELMGRNASSPAARRNISRLARSPNFSQINRNSQEQALNAVGSRPEDRAYCSRVQNLVNSGNFRNQSPQNQTTMLREITGNTEGAEQLDRMMRSDRFNAMSQADQTRMVNVFNNTSNEGRTSLNTLLNRDRDGQSILQSRGIDPSSPTLLQELDRQATTEMDSRVEGGREAASEALLAEVANPDGEINQSNRGTCSVTTISHDLATRHPAEYARLQTDLMTTGRSRLANGDEIRVPSDAFASDDSSRSTGERVLQASLMQYGRPDRTYHNTITAEERAALPPEERAFVEGRQSGFTHRSGTDTSRVASGVFNQPYETREGSSSELLSQTRARLRPGRPVLTSLDWGSDRHAVEVTRIEGGRVYFRNPWGAGVGTHVDGDNEPTRRTEDASRGMESMTIEEYQRRARAIYVPR